MNENGVGPCGDVFMKWALCGLFGLVLAGCATPLLEGERLYREGDRLGALETWRSVPEDSALHERTRERIAVVEEEFQQLVVRYKQRARYYEAKRRLAEAILNNRLALKLQPDDAETLAHVQELARVVVSAKKELRSQYQVAFESGDLADAGRRLAQLRTLDPFDPVLEADERQLSDALRDAVTHLLAAGRRGFSDGNHTAARRSFRSVLALDPDNESARGYLSYIETIRRESETMGRAPRRSGGQPAAFDPPAAFASDAEIRAEGFYQNALAAERSGDLYGAIRLDLRALVADRGHRGAGRHLSAIRARLADRVEGLIESGRGRFRKEDLEAALDSWRRALLVDPDNQRARAYVIRAERELENLERLRSEPDVASGGR